MSSLLDNFKRTEADTVAQSVQFNRWSLILIEMRIAQQEEKLLASDLPVETTSANDNFWEGLN